MGRLSNSDLMLEIIKDIQCDVKDIKKEQISQGLDIAKNKDDIKDHMKRSDNIEKVAKFLEHRIVKLEEPRTVRKYLYNFFVGVSAGGGLIYGIIQIFKFFKEV
jgi:hypothetical protein